MEQRAQLPGDGFKPVSSAGHLYCDFLVAYRVEHPVHRRERAAPQNFEDLVAVVKHFTWPIDLSRRRRRRGLRSLLLIEQAHPLSDGVERCGPLRGLTMEKRLD